MRAFAALAALSVLPACGQQFSVLVFTKTTGFRHGSIPNGIAAVKQLGADNNFAVDQTEDSSVFNDDNLSRYRVVVFLNTTGDVLDDAQQAAFERYIHHGGGFVGVHSATDTEYDWPFYGQLVGTYFQDHPGIQQAVIHPADRAHPSTAALPDNWVRTDEWYNFRANPRPQVHVLATLDETTYDGGTMGDHPLTWCHDFEGGRAWYTGMGHTEDTFSEPLYLQHLLGGILTVAGAVPAHCGPDPLPRSESRGPELGRPEGGRRR